MSFDPWSNLNEENFVKHQLKISAEE
jgi:hypothetical protein